MPAIKSQQASHSEPAALVAQLRDAGSTEAAIATLSTRLAPALAESAELRRLAYAGEPDEIEAFIRPLRLQSIAQTYARRLLTVASAQEPAVTNTLSALADETGGALVGLEYRLKFEESLTRKLADRTTDRVKYPIRQGTPPELVIQDAVAEQASNVNDALRYTITLPTGQYTQGYKTIRAELEAQGYALGREWNAWRDIGTKRDGGYRGINLTVTTPEGQVFELQVHTPESFHAKMEGHILYEEIRLPTTSEARRAELARLQKKQAESVPIPEGITRKQQGGER